MGAMFSLYNFTKREMIGGHRIGASAAREYVWNHAPGALMLWYMFRNRGDQIAFISDYDVDLKKAFFGQVATPQLLNEFVDKTDEALAQAIAAGVLEDHGFHWRDEEDPEVYQRDIRIRNKPGRLPDDGLF